MSVIDLDAFRRDGKVRPVAESNDPPSDLPSLVAFDGPTEVGIIEDEDYPIVVISKETNTGFALSRHTAAALISALVLALKVDLPGERG